MCFLLLLLIVSLYCSNEKSLVFQQAGVPCPRGKEERTGVSGECMHYFIFIISSFFSFLESLLFSLSCIGWQSFGFQVWLCYFSKRSIYIPHR